MNKRLTSKQIYKIIKNNISDVNAIWYNPLLNQWLITLETTCRMDVIYNQLEKIGFNHRMAVIPDKEIYGIFDQSKYFKTLAKENN